MHICTYKSLHQCAASVVSTVHNGVDSSRFLDHVNLILRALKKSERSVLSFVRYIKKCFYFVSHLFERNKL